MTTTSKQFADETKAACVFPPRPRPACRSNRPDTYQRIPISRKFSLANASRSVHRVRSGRPADLSGMSAFGIILL